MSNFREKLEPADVIAIIVIVGGLALKFTGADGLVGTLLTAVVIYYFGDRTIGGKILKKQDQKKLYGGPEEIIRRVAGSEGVDSDLAIRIARCESGLDPKAVNVNNTGSKDRGIFQWNDKYHPEITDVCAFDVECSTRAFCRAVRGGNISWWDASKKCWNV